MNLIDITKKQIDDLVNKACDKARASGVLPMGGLLVGVVEIPRDSSHGDYASTHAMAAARELKMPPRKIAEVLCDNMELSGSLFTKVEIADPGFINFFLSSDWYKEALRIVDVMGNDYGCVDVGKGKRVMVEFVSANPTGPMTIGNARGAVLGDTLASVLEKAGYNVWREFLVNDAGNQISVFGRSLDARYMQLCLGEDKVAFPEDGYHGDDIRELAKQIYDKDGDSFVCLPAAEREKIFSEYALPINIARMKQDLERYNIKFDEWFHESQLHESGYVEETVRLLDEGDLLYEKDGAVWLRNSALGADKDKVLRRANGFYTYFAADIAYHRNKLERGFDKAIDIWGGDHHGHLHHLMISLASNELGAALGVDGSKYVFLIMQMIRIMRDGEMIKVSKRTGKALTLGDLLDEVSVDACRFFFNVKADSHIDFDLGLAVRQDSENPVYYVQYAHARIYSLISILAAEGHIVPDFNSIDVGLLSSVDELELIKQIALFPDEVASAARDYDPSKINRYVVELAAKFHKFYYACRIKGEESSLLSARLKLADLTRIAIKNCLDLLGVSAPIKM